MDDGDFGDAFATGEQTPALDVTTRRMSEYSAWTFEIRCGCRTAYYPVALLAARLGANPTLGNVAGRLICKKCRNRAATVDLIDSPAGRNRIIPVLPKPLAAG